MKEENKMAAGKEIINAVELMREGNQEGFNILYSQTSDYVYKRAKFIMKNEDDTLDLMQETYTQIYKNIASLEKAENVYAWIGAIVYRQGMRIFRDKKEILVDEGAEIIFDDIVSEDMEANPEESAEAKATVDIVMSLIEELPELQKAAIIAFYYDNKKIDDIATEFECSANTIKSRLNYAKKFLRDKVESHEKHHGYKLHTISPVIIIAALRALFGSQRYVMSPEASQALYANVLNTSGASSVTATVATTTSATTTSAEAVSTVAATKIGMGIGVKLAIGVATASITVAAVVGGIAVVSHQEETTVLVALTTELVAENESTDNIVDGENDSEDVTEINTQETTNSIEATTDNISADGWKSLEGQYVYAYGEFDKALVISNVTTASDDINDVAFDIEYCGMPGQNIVVNDRTVTFTVNHADGSVSDVELLIWTGFKDNSGFGQLIELKSVTTTTSEGMVGSMNSNVPVVYSKEMAKTTDTTIHRWPIKDGVYESYESYTDSKPEGYTYSVSIETTQYQNNYSERVVTIEILDKDGQLLDTLVSEAFSDTKDSYCNFWARSTEGRIFVGHIDGISDGDVIVLNCHLTGLEAPAWYEGINIVGYLKGIS